MLKDETNSSLEQDLKKNINTLSDAVEESEKFIENQNEDNIKIKINRTPKNDQNISETEFKNDAEQPIKQEQKDNERKAADALIVAALMGNSIMRFKAGAANSKQNQNKRLTGQTSVPVGHALHSPANSASNSFRINATKSLNENEVTKPEQVCMEELNTSKQQDSNNNTISKSLINKLNSGNKSNISNKSNQNISSVSNTRNTNSSKASKCMLDFYFIRKLKKKTLFY